MKQIISKLFSRMSMVAILATTFAGTLLAAEVTDVIDHSATSSSLGNTGTTAWGTNFSITGTSGAEYYIHSMGTKNTTNALQWNANGFLYMTKTPSGYKLKSVTITTTANKNISVYAQNSAYSAAPSGTALHTLAATSSGNTYSFDSDYSYLALKGTASSTSITSISIVWEEASAAVETVTTIDHSGITNTDVYLGTESGTLSATVKDNNNNVISGASVLWSGNNDDVATINSNTGAVTLVSAGTVTFTATYAGVSGQYKSSFGTYQMTVTSSAPYVQPTEFDINLNNSLFGTNYTGTASGITDETPISGTKDNVTVTYAGAGNHYVNDSQIRFYPSNKLTFEAPSGYDIKSIVFTSAGTWTATISADSGEYTSSTKTWTGSSSSVVFTASGSGVRCEMSKVTITIGKAAPSIVANNLDIAYDAAAGSIAFSIANEPSPAGTLTASTESDWLTVGTVGANVPFTCTENNTAAERTATVTLSYSYGDNESVTKEVTVTQARNPNVVPTISQVRAQGTGTAVTKGVVTTITGSDKKTAYIQDATAAIVVYGDFTASVGDEIRVSGTLSTYKGLLEFTSPTVTVLSSGNTVTPTVMTIAEINSSSNQGWYVKIEDATVTEIDGQDTMISQGENTILVHGISGVEYGVNDIITLEGNIGCFNTVQISNPTNVTVQEVTTPTIVVSPNVKNLTAALSEGTLDIVYENLPIADMDDFDIVFYEEVGGNTIGSAPDWIEVLVAEQDPNVGEGYVVSYSVSENEGDARSVSFQVYAFDEEGTEVYSNFVTINQAAPVVDYATLPFAYDGNGQNELPVGFTVSGVASYTSGSPAMKFDDTGDYAILKFNESPVVLTFDIKGNGFSGGTFTVQTSVDGVAYTNLATYTELGTTQNVTFDNVPVSARYIKWVYTQKSSGNVALGNITLSKKQPAAPDTYDRNLTAGDGGYWGTFYNGVADYQLPEGAQAFTMNVNKQLYRLGSNGRVIPAGTAVVIIADVEAVTLTKGGSPEPVAPNGGDNILLGDDFPVEGDGTQYVLGKKGNVIGFYKFLGSEIPANKAYYVVSE